ncbi:MAG TPA: hypothetical protein VGC49_10705 [Solirubrobacterales bacterium]|jgi:hypothetical protein
MTDEGTAKDLMAEAETAINAGTLERLDEDASKCTRAGRWFFGIAIVVGIALLAVSYHLTGVYVGDLEKAKDPPLMLVLLLVRGTLFGGLSIGFLYGIFTVGNAYIDQATRFRKRLYSAHMLNYAFATFSEEIKTGEKVKVDDVVRLFYAWNANVDSAFSRVAFQKTSKNLVIGNGSRRLAVEDPPPSHGEPQRHWPAGANEGIGVVGIPIVGNWPNGKGSPLSGEQPTTPG